MVFVAFAAKLLFMINHMEMSVFLYMRVVRSLDDRELRVSQSGPDRLVGRLVGGVVSPVTHSVLSDAPTFVALCGCPLLSGNSEGLGGDPWPDSLRFLSSLTGLLLGLVTQECDLPVHMFSVLPKSLPTVFDTFFF